MHADDDEHDTPVRTAFRDPAGLRARWTVQFMPFQRSASVPAANPTAVQAVTDVQDTLARWPDRLTRRLRVGRIAHLVPFQRSASVTPTPPGPAEVPTAMHRLADEQDTPASELVTDRAGSRVDRMAHLVPFQRSASASPALWPSVR
jgi:hypothetical protein